MENHHRILHIRISLGSKFQFQQTISIILGETDNFDFLDQVCPKKVFPDEKEYFWSKIEKVNITIEFCIFELVWVPNFRLD